MAPPLIRQARPEDLGAVHALLTHHHLPLDGLPDGLEGFVVATEPGDGAVVGVAGLERYGDSALLRSVAVAEGRRGTGRALVEALIAAAKRDGLASLVLLTTTAGGYFPRFGFVPTSRDTVPAAVKASAEFRGACPASALVMMRRL